MRFVGTNDDQDQVAGFAELVPGSKGRLHIGQFVVGCSGRQRAAQQDPEAVRIRLMALSRPRPRTFSAMQTPLESMTYIRGIESTP